ncbi:MAG: hypothetical protein J7J20_00925 [Desulfurococcales archaeon]|nr:hypothetical protein [Desulfurococcales archaeon]
MFKVTYPDGSKLKKLMQGALKPLSDVPIAVGEGELLIRALSPDKNLLVEITIPQSAFDAFEVSRESNITAERDQLLKAIRRATKRDTVTLKYEEGSRQMTVVLSNSRTGAERSYMIDIMEAGREPVQSLYLELPVKFQVASDDFRKIVRDAKLVGEELEFIYKEGSIEVISRSESKEFRQTLMLDKPLYSLESKESMVTSKYDLDLLRSISASFDVADIALVEFGAGLPMKVTLSVEDGSKVVFWIAPRA